MDIPCAPEQRIETERSGVPEAIWSTGLTGGFATIASLSNIESPESWREATIYQKDRGEKTPTVAAAIKDYNPAKGGC